MRQNKISILSTGELPRNLLQAAGVNGFLIDVVPFIRIERVNSSFIKNRIEEISRLTVTVAITSMNAAEIVIELLEGRKADWRIFCVGNTTTEILSGYFGKDAISVSAPNAATLAKAIVANGSIEEIFFFCGDKRRHELPEILNENGIEMEEVVVYETLYLPKVVEASYSGILFFSPGAVESFFWENVPAIDTTLFAIGETTGSQLKKHTSNTVIVASEPGRENLLKAMFEYYESQSLNADAKINE